MSAASVRKMTPSAPMVGPKTLVAVAWIWLTFRLT